MHRAQWFVGAILCCIAMIPHSAFATQADEKRGEALFKEGVAKMTEMDYDAACPLLSESYRVSPAAGTLFTLAHCEYDGGKLLASRANFKRFIVLYGAMRTKDRFKERITIASEKLDILEKEIPRLTVIIPSEAPAGTLVFLDEKELSRKQLGRAIDIDLGNHTLRSDVPGQPQLTMALKMERSEHKIREVIVDKNNPIAAQRNRWRMATISAFAVGGAGWITWGITGGLAISNKKNVENNCFDLACNGAGMAAVEKGRTLSNVATVGFGVGIAGAAVGTAMWLIDRGRNKQTSEKETGLQWTVDAGPGVLGVNMKGAF